MVLRLLTGAVKASAAATSSGTCGERGLSADLALPSVAGRAKQESAARRPSWRRPSLYPHRGLLPRWTLRRLVEKRTTGFGRHQIVTRQFL